MNTIASATQVATTVSRTVARAVRGPNIARVVSTPSACSGAPALRAVTV